MAELPVADLLAFAHFATVVRYANVAAYCLFVYDWLLCLGQEAAFIFNAASSLAKVAYILCRYVPLLGFPVNIWGQVIDHDHDTCEKIFRAPMLMVMGYNATASFILILRIYAFTSGNRIVASILLFLVAVNAGYLVWVVFVPAILNPIGHVCVPVEAGTTIHISGLFLGSFLLDCIITSTFIAYLFRVYKLKYTQMSELTRMFIREGAAYFLAISAINLLNVAFNMQPYVPMADVNVPWSLLFPNLLGCRLVLNLRRAAFSDREITLTTSGAVSLSSEAEQRRMEVLRGLGSRHRDVELYPMGATFDDTHHQK